MSVGDIILDRDENRPAYVQFERRAVKDNEATLAAGHYVAKDEDYALITPPYSKDLVIKKVDKWFEQTQKNVTRGRVPVEHFETWQKMYQRWLDGQEAPVDGTSVKDWNAISPAQCQNLINAGCRTIEDLAQANDEAMRRLGMGGQELRNKAKAWLQAAKDHGPLTMEVASLQKENDTLKASLDALQEQVKLMKIQLEAQSGETSNSPPRHQMSSAGEIDLSSTVSITETTPTEQYIAKFGKKPHHKMKDETILRKLQE